MTVGVGSGRWVTLEAWTCDPRCRVCRGGHLGSDKTGSFIPGTGSVKRGYPGYCGCTPGYVLGGTTTKTVDM